MRKLHALLLTTLLACSLVVVAATQALACSCIPPQPDPKAAKEAAAVFTGTVIDTEDGVKVGFDEVTWTFAVDTVYKGDVADTQEIESHTQSAACGVIFKEQKRYVVFAHKGGPTEPVSSARDVLSTNSCMNTRELDATDKLELKPIDRNVAAPPPFAEPQQSWGVPQVVVTALIVLVALGGAVFAWKKDRKEGV